MTGNMARVIIVLIWSFAASIMCPWAVFYQQRDADDEPEELHLPTGNTSDVTAAPSTTCADGERVEYVCMQLWPSPRMERNYFLGAIFVTCYTIPLVVISVCYGLVARRVCNRGALGLHDGGGQTIVRRSKVKVIKMLVTVVVVFTFSWLPLYVVNLRRYYGPPIDPSSLEFSLLIRVIIPVTQWAGSANSCVNPFIYCFFSNKFRAGFKQLFAAAGCCRRCYPSDDARMRFGDRATTAYSTVSYRRGDVDGQFPVRRGAVKRLAASSQLTTCATGPLGISTIAADLTIEATAM